jgi:hypothetical protein
MISAEASRLGFSGRLEPLGDSAQKSVVMSLQGIGNLAGDGGLPPCVRTVAA